LPPTSGCVGVPQMLVTPGAGPDWLQPALPPSGRTSLLPPTSGCVGVPQMLATPGAGVHPGPLSLYRFGGYRPGPDWLQPALPPSGRTSFLPPTSGCVGVPQMLATPGAGIAPPLASGDQQHVLPQALATSAVQGAAQIRTELSGSLPEAPHSFSAVPAQLATTAPAASAASVAATFWAPSVVPALPAASASHAVPFLAPLPAPLLPAPALPAEPPSASVPTSSATPLQEPLTALSGLPSSAADPGLAGGDKKVAAPAMAYVALQDFLEDEDGYISFRQGDMVYELYVGGDGEEVGWSYGYRQSSRGVYGWYPTKHTTLAPSQLAAQPALAG